MTFQKANRIALEPVLCQGRGVPIVRRSKWLLFRQVAPSQSIMLLIPIEF